MTNSAENWKKKIRKFVDTDLIPWEVHAELNNGELPKEVQTKHSKIALSFGLPGMGISEENGGLGLSMFEQMIIWEQLGRVTNALCWCFPEGEGTNTLERRGTPAPVFLTFGALKGDMV